MLIVDLEEQNLLKTELREISFIHYSVCTVNTCPTVFIWFFLFRCFRKKDRWFNVK